MSALTYGVLALIVLWTLFILRQQFALAEITPLTPPHHNLPLPINYPPPTQSQNDGPQSILVTYANGRYNLTGTATPRPMTNIRFSQTGDRKQFFVSCRVGRLHTP